MKLIEAIQDVIRHGHYETSWGVWAEEPFSPESEARIGQTDFENGGVLDDKVFFATFAHIIDEAWQYCEGDPLEQDHFSIEEIAYAVYEEIEEFIRSF